MKPMAFLGASAASLVGAGLWAAVAHISGYEVGIVAWVVGGIVGFGAHILGGRGAACGLVCAVLAVGAIFCGKVLAYHVGLNREMDSWLEVSVTPENYQRYMREVKAYDDVETEYDVQEYMVTFGYTEAQYPYQVSDEEMKAFLADTEPQIKQAAANPPSYEQWGEGNEAYIEGVKDSLSGVGAVVNDLDRYDLLFAVLGIVTAFRVGASGLDKSSA